MTVPSRTYNTRAEWLAARKQGLGASDIAAILGVDPWRSPLRVYADKLDLLPQDEQSEPMEWGLLLEPAIIERYKRTMNRVVERPAPFTIYRDERTAFLAVTPDAFTSQGVTGLARAPLEVKNVAVFKGDDWKEEAPLAYQIQLQVQIYVLDQDWGALAGCIGGNRGVVYDMSRNDAFIRTMLEKAEAFWEAVQTKKPPTPTAMDTKLLALLYPDVVEGSTIRLPEEALTWAGARLEADTQLKYWRDVKDNAEALLKGHIGEHEIGLLPDGSASFSWKTVNRKGYEVQPTSYRELRRKAIKG